MQAGSNWVGNYSRFSYNEAKQYLMLLKEQGVAVLDDEFNMLQETLWIQMRRAINKILGDGSPDNGFNIVSSGTDNNFTIKSGKFFLNGIYTTLDLDINYSAQTNITPPALTTPSGSNRTDTVYLDIWMDEITHVQDSNIVDPVLGSRTSCRLGLKWAVRVAENSSSVPSDGMDGDNLYHYYCRLATLSRLDGNAAISNSMITDNRQKLNLSRSNVRIVTANTTLLGTDRYVVVNSASPVTITLAAVANYFSSVNSTTSELVIFNIGAGLVTVNPSGVETINGSGTGVSLSRYQTFRGFTDASTTNWHAFANQVGFAKLFDGNGYQKLPSGLIIQWGLGTVPASGTSGSSVTVTFPIAFTGDVYFVAATPLEAVNAGIGDQPAVDIPIANITFTQMKVTLGATAGSVFSNTVSFKWLAIGY